MMVSIIIPTFKRVAQTLVTVGKVIASAKNTGSEYEVIVTDNTPDDSLQNALEKEFGEAIVYTKAPVLGIGANKNNGVRVSTGDMIIFCDSDIEVAPDAIEKTITALHNNPSAGGVGGTVVWKGGEKDGTKDRPQETDRTIQMGKTTYIEVLYGRYFGTYKKILEDVGPYDEVVFNFLGESSDMSTRFWRAGYPLIYDPSIVVQHMHDAPESMATRIEHPEHTIIRNWLLLLYRFDMFGKSNDHFREHVGRYLDTLGENKYMAFFDGFGKYTKDIVQSIGYLQDHGRTKEVYDFGFLEVFSNKQMLEECLSHAEERIASTLSS